MGGINLEVISDGWNLLLNDLCVLGVVLLFCFGNVSYHPIFFKGRGCHPLPILPGTWNLPLNRKPPTVAMFHSVPFFFVFRVGWREDFTEKNQQKHLQDFENDLAGRCRSTRRTRRISGERRTRGKFFQIRFSQNTNKDLQIKTCPFMVHGHMSGALYRPQSDLTIEFFAQLFMSHHSHIQDHDTISP